MRISKAQMKKLSTAVDRRFIARMTRHLAEVLPDTVAAGADGRDPAQAQDADGAISPLLEQALRYADAHGFFHEDEIALVVLLHAAARTDPAIENLLQPWAAEALQRDESSTLARIVWIEHEVAERAATDPAARRLQTALHCTREAFG